MPVLEQKEGFSSETITGKSINAVMDVLLVHASSPREAFGMLAICLREVANMSERDGEPISNETIASDILVSLNSLVQKKMDA